MEINNIYVEICIYFCYTRFQRRSQRKGEPMLGTWGEERAAVYLADQGYEILDRNYRCKAGEIDIVALEGSTVVFVEVKTRCSLACGLPGDSVTNTKKQHIRRTARWYVAEHRMEDRDLRIDVMELLVSGGSVYLKHNINAF
ncbi:MAG: YraN family protein [Firmicutes bacterium HGW-Firmicutes-11]|nr:MAG: YraN family protein [Firmicutes bacterium HGW-Firmicutes-11]